MKPAIAPPEPATDLAMTPQSGTAWATLNWRWFAFPLLLLVILLQIDALTRHSLWNDEFITLRVIALDYPELIQNRYAASHVPGYFVVLKAWTALVGLNDAALRFPSAVVTLLGILLVWRLGAYLFGERAGVLVLALAGLNQIHYEQGGNARMYASLFMASAGALYGLVHYLDRGKPLTLALLVASGVVGMMVHLLYALVPAAACVYLAARRKTFPGRWRRALIGLLLPLLLAAPVALSWFQLQDKVGGHETYQTIGLRDAFRQTFIIFTGDTRGSGFKVLLYSRLFLVLGALAIVASQMWKSSRGTRQAGVSERYLGLLLIWIFFPLIALAVGEIFSSTNVAGLWRYYVTQAAAAPLIFAAAALILQKKAGAKTAVPVAVAVVLMLSINTAGYMISPETGLREVAYYVRDHRSADAPIVVSRQKTRSLAFTYYAGFESVPPHVPEEIEDPDLVADWLQDFCADHEEIWAVFYDGFKKDKLYHALRTHPEFFEPMGEIYTCGETATGLYRRIDAAKGN